MSPTIAPIDAQQVTHRLELSPFDQTGPRLYVHKFYCFEFPDPKRQDEAVERLEQCLSATILRWPFIVGRVGPSQVVGEEKLLELRYSTPVIGQVEREILTVHNVSKKEIPWTYQELAEAGMPPSALDMNVLSTVPEWPNPHDTYPALAIQANFMAGGLILCFAFHHAVADGGSFTAFVKEFGAAVNTCPAADAVLNVVQKRLGYAPTPGGEHRALSSFPAYDPGNTQVRPKHSATVTTRILQFSATTVKALEQAVAKQLKDTIGPHAWASNIACLSSLVWVAVVRARRGRLNPEEIAKIGVAVNVRSVMNPALPEDYFGNAMLHTIATAEVSELLNNDESANVEEIQSSVSIAAVALAAWRMREAVKCVDSKYVADRLEAFSALSDPTELGRAYGRAMDCSNTAIDFSSWRDQGADVEFDIPGTATSTVGFWRKAWSPNEGAYNILPRKGGSKGSAVWEVSLGLNVGDMARVCAAEELGGWICRVLE